MKQKKRQLTPNLMKKIVQTVNVNVYERFCLFVKERLFSFPDIFATLLILTCEFSFLKDHHIIKLHLVS